MKVYNTKFEETEDERNILEKLFKKKVIIIGRLSDEGGCV